MELAHRADCDLCGKSIRVICSGCGYMPDDRVHIDCVTAKALLNSALAP
jgi:hypothetical protein